MIRGIMQDPGRGKEVLESFEDEKFEND